MRYELCFGLNQYTCFVHVCVLASVLLREILCDPSIPAQKIECQATMDIDALTYQQTLMLQTPVVLVNELNLSSSILNFNYLYQSRFKHNFLSTFVELEVKERGKPSRLPTQAAVF